MARAEIGETVASRSGRPISGASVQVNKRSGTAATVYSAETGTTTVANPLTTDAYGRIEGWLPEGSFDLVVTANGSSYTQRFEAIKGGAAGASTFSITDGAYGAACDGTTDDTAAVLAAVAAANAAGGGDVVIPGPCKISSTITLSSHTVKLRGVGRHLQLFGTLSSPYKGSSLLWYGSAGQTMVEVRAGNGAATTLRGAGVTDLLLDGRELADCCLRVRSVTGGQFARLSILRAQTVGLEVTTEVSILDGVEDVQECVFDSILSRVGVDGSNASCIGMRLTGSTAGAGNFSLNSGTNLTIVHKDGTAFYLGYSDSNTFDQISITRVAGTGIGVELAGFNDARFCNSNRFGTVTPGDGGLTARATGFSAPSSKNSVANYCVENGAPAVTVEVGATFRSAASDTGAVSGRATYGLDLKPGTWTTAIRFPNNVNVSGRNAADGADVTMFLFNTLNETQFMSPTRFSGTSLFDAAVTLNAAVTMSDGFGFTIGSGGTGVRIGTATTQKIGFWNVTPVVRPTGWAAATNTKARTTFDTTTVTTANLAARVGALLDDLIAIGLIGA